MLVTNLQKYVQRWDAGVAAAAAAAAAFNKAIPDERTLFISRIRVHCSTRFDRLLLLRLQNEHTNTLSHIYVFFFFFFFLFQQ